MNFFSLRYSEQLIHIKLLQNAQKTQKDFSFRNFWWMHRGTHLIGHHSRLIFELNSQQENFTQSSRSLAATGMGQNCSTENINTLKSIGYSNAKRFPLAVSDSILFLLGP